MNKRIYYIANWKMYFSYIQALAWSKENIHELNELSYDKNIVICPSYESIAPIANVFAGSSVALGAQNCSAHNLGAFTGQVSIQSLRELGVSYCIVGHSEVRKYCGESNNALSDQLSQLMNHAIIPIFCIGESLIDYQNGSTDASIKAQLEPIIKFFSKKSDTRKQCFIAYEPVWAIGTGIVANNEYIVEVFKMVRLILQESKIEDLFNFIYGGSVTASTIQELKKIEGIDGFLIGKASTDIQELKKIVV